LRQIKYRFGRRVFNENASREKIFDENSSQHFDRQRHALHGARERNRQRHRQIAWHPVNARQLRKVSGAGQP